MAMEASVGASVVLWYHYYSYITIAAMKIIATP